MMSAFSRSWTGLAEALTGSFLSSCVARRCLHKALSRLAKTEERSQCENVGVWVALVEDPLLPGEFGLYSRTWTIHEGPSLMADLMNRTLVNVSSFMFGMCDRKLTVSRYPVLHIYTRVSFSVCDGLVAASSRPSESWSGCPYFSFRRLAYRLA